MDSTFGRLTEEIYVQIERYNAYLLLAHIRDRFSLSHLMTLRYSNRDRSLETVKSRTRDEDDLLRETWETRNSQPLVRAAAIPAREFSVRKIMENLSCSRSTTNWNWLAHLGLCLFTSVKSRKLCVCENSRSQFCDSTLRCATEIDGNEHWYALLWRRHRFALYVSVNGIEFFLLIV